MFNMSDFPEKLEIKLRQREEDKAYRELSSKTNLIDFSSNDYLGFAKNETLYANAFQLLLNKGIAENGATGSRLISGNHQLYFELETLLSKLFETESALVYNSGYDANVGFFSTVPQRGDVILFDELVHASIRDGILLSNAKSFKFKHNSITDLKEKAAKVVQSFSGDFTGEIYIVTESVFSMDGDTVNIADLITFSRKHNFRLVIDEAHAIGVFGKNGEGLIQQNRMHEYVFARIATFGKGLGCNGAAILGSKRLTEYLVNFSRSFIYTTGLPPHTVATIISAFKFITSPEGESAKHTLQESIDFFKEKLVYFKLQKLFISSNSAIQSCVIPGNTRVKKAALKLQEKGFNIKAILSPTVPKGEERLRFCLHSYNSQEEIMLLLQILASILK